MSSDDWTPEPPDPDDQLRITVALKGAFADSAEEAAEELDISFDWILPQAETFAEERGAEMIGMRRNAAGKLIPNPRAEWVISDTTRDAANKMLREALKEGWSYKNFASRLEESGLFEGPRAELVARNEIAQAMIGGKKASFAEADVTYGYVYDGDGDPECAARNGTIMEVADFELLHPNCEGDIRPATQAELEEAGLGD